jgi:hypothetical protein
MIFGIKFTTNYVKPIHNTILLFGLGASVLFGVILGYSYRLPKQIVEPKVKAKGYTIIEAGVGINQDGDTIQIKPIFK